MDGGIDGAGRTVLAGERVEAVLAATRPCRSLDAWLSAALAALDLQLGFSRTSLMLVLSAKRPSIRRAFAGDARGIHPQMLAEYFERWADCDPLASEPARAMFESLGYASTTALYPALDPGARRFVEQFLHPAGIADQLSLHLPGKGATDGYLTIHAASAIPAWRTGPLAALAPGLAAQLRRWLPRGLNTDLSMRERQASELVSFGFSNREIAAVLNVNEDGVKKHLYRAMTKLGMDNRTELAVAWMTGRPVALPRAIAPMPAKTR